jgi:hypothetical protein
VEDYTFRVHVYPRILCPGDVGYSGETHVLDNVSNPDDIISAEVTVYYTQTLRTKKEIPVKDVEIVPYIQQYKDMALKGYPQLHAEVTVVNNTNRTIIDYTICVVLYDKDNKILVVLGNNYTRLKPGEKAIPKTLYSDIQFNEIYPKIKTIKSFCWTYSG